MNLYEKISTLGPSAQYDTCGPKDFGKTTNIPGVYHAKVGGNNICRLFKVLQSNKCVNNCYYCAFRRDRDTPRITASSDEMAEAFISAFSRRLVDGFFLSSGIDSHPDTTMTRVLDTASILREKYHYKGYIHLKVMPGTSVSCIQESIKVADRISLNIESPTEQDLLALTPNKSLKYGFFTTLNLIKREIKKFQSIHLKAPSLTTQFVVGAGTEKDLDLIRITNLLYKRYELKRVFFSAFRPVPDTPLEEKEAVSLIREHRLYQADFLMRFYHFSPLDIPLDQEGFLSEIIDPKMLWAQRHPEYYPVNINSANYWKLLRVPGIGPVSAKKIIQIRKHGRLKSFYRLQGNRLQINKLSSFICF
ncbi:helix-hairpin-helix domain-containing protein [Candidatus Dojkabacteria bacterium]|nr:helix-hairpin-helix domain-containing protein [Candidatus Dojkabacteria bacterium]